MNSIYTLQLDFPKIHFNIILLSSTKSSECFLHFRISNHSIVGVCHLSHLYYIACQSHPASCCLCRWGVTVSQNCGQQYAYCSSPTFYMSVESYDGMILTVEALITRRRNCPSATLSTTNPTWIEPGADPGLRGERPATNCLNRARPKIWKEVVVA
jgi:hypothetical protein